MQSIQPHDLSPLQNISTLPYNQQYQRWCYFLVELQQNKNPNLNLYLQMCLQRFPYSFIHWQKLIYLTPKQNLLDVYSQIVKKIPRCPQFWKQYLDILKEQKHENYKKMMQQAIKDVGSDLNSFWLFEEYEVLVTDVLAKFQFYKRLLTRPINKLEDLMMKFKQWLDKLRAEQLQQIYFRESKDATNKQNHKQYILNLINSSYKNALTYRDKRSEIEKQIRCFYFSNYESRVQELSIWRKYILLERENNQVDNVCYCYERALLSHTDNVELWLEVFHYLQNEVGKHLSLLNLLRNNREFFLNFSSNLYFYWCNLEERENPAQARKMYIQLEEYRRIGDNQAQCQLHVYLRHIQFEIRCNELMNAKNIFDKLVMENQSNTERLSYLLVQYGNFIVTKYKQPNYTKDMYNIYFNHLKYNRYLFSNYLAFMRNFQNNEGYYDELMEIIQKGYEKAVLEGEVERNECLKIVRSHLRVSLGKMNLIKISEKRLYELQKRTKETQEEKVNMERKKEEDVRDG